MIIVLEGSQRSKLQYYFDAMFSLRHKVFVKGRGWNLPTVNGQFEIDQYDVSDAVYFLDIDDAGSIQGTVRMTPTAKYSLMADYFPHLVENGSSPRSTAIYEATRYLVLPERKIDSRVAKTRLILAVVEWCLSKKLSHLQAVVDTATLPTFIEMTPRTIPLGLSHPYGGGRRVPGGGECIAFRWPITLEVLEDVRAYGGFDPRMSGWSAPTIYGPPATLETAH